MARAERLHFFVRLDVLLYLLQRFRRRDVLGAELEIAGPVRQFFTRGPAQERRQNRSRCNRRTKFQECAFVHWLECGHELRRMKTISIPSSCSRTVAIVHSVAQDRKSTRLNSS